MQFVEKGKGILKLEVVAENTSTVLAKVEKDGEKFISITFKYQGTVIFLPQNDFIAFVNLISSNYNNLIVKELNNETRS